MIDDELVRRAREDLAVIEERIAVIEERIAWAQGRRREIEIFIEQYRWYSLTEWNRRKLRNMRKMPAASTLAGVYDDDRSAILDVLQSEVREVRACWMRGC